MHRPVLPVPDIFILPMCTGLCIKTMQIDCTYS